MVLILHRLRGRPILGFLMGLGLAPSCQLVLGDRDVWGGDRACEEDTDCGPDEKCNGITELKCRERCVEGQQCSPYVLCDEWDLVCPDPLGSPCDAENVAECGGLLWCEDKNSDNEAVKGYCTVLCPNDTPCPPGYECDSDHRCLCVDGRCTEQFEPFLGDSSNSSGD